MSAINGNNGNNVAELEGHLEHLENYAEQIRLNGDDMTSQELVELRDLMADAQAHVDSVVNGDLSGGPFSTAIARGSQHLERIEVYLEDLGQDIVGADFEIPSYEAELLGDVGEQIDTSDIDELLDDPEALYDLYTNDPEGFGDAWQEMSPEDRTLAMSRVQEGITAVSQMTTMMTNLLQSMHSSTMAVARNLNV